VVVFESLPEPVAKLTVSSSPSAAATVSSMGTPLLEVQLKKADVRWLGGGPLTNANEQPPSTIERAAIARGARTLRGGIEAEVTEESTARVVPIVILGAAL
jgi:hypothetical protein